MREHRSTELLEGEIMDPVKELLGSDFDDMGLAETIDNVTENQIQMEAVCDAIGRAIFVDGGLLEDDLVDPHGLMKTVAFDCDRVMNMLCYYARQSEKFMERL